MDTAEQCCDPFVGVKHILQGVCGFGKVKHRTKPNYFVIKVTLVLLLKKSLLLNVTSAKKKPLQIIHFCVGAANLVKESQQFHDHYIQIEGKDHSKTTKHTHTKNDKKKLIWMIILRGTSQLRQLKNKKKEREKKWTIKNGLV